MAALFLLLSFWFPVADDYFVLVQWIPTGAVSAAAIVAVTVIVVVSLAVTVVLVTAV